MSRRIVIQSILILALAALQARGQGASTTYEFVQVVQPSDQESQEADRRRIELALRRARQPWNRIREFMLDVSLHDQEIRWEVSFEIEAAQRELLDRGTGEHRELVWLNWFGGWNAKITELTHRVLKDANVTSASWGEAPVSVEFVVGTSDCECETSICLICDDVVIRYGDPATVISDWPTRAITAEKRRAKLEATITPDREIWEERETITGKYVLKNVGTTWACVPPISLREPELRAVDGSQLESFDADMFICRSLITGFPPHVIKSGGQIEFDFTLVTNPESDMYGAIAPPGQYELVYPGRFWEWAHEGRLPIEIRTIPVTIRIVESNDRAKTYEAEKTFQPPEDADDSTIEDVLNP